MIGPAEIRHKHPTSSTALYRSLPDWNATAEQTWSNHGRGHVPRRQAHSVTTPAARLEPDASGVTERAEDRGGQPGPGRRMPGRWHGFTGRTSDVRCDRSSRTFDAPRVDLSGRVRGRGFLAGLPTRSGAHPRRLSPDDPGRPQGGCAPSPHPEPVRCKPIPNADYVPGNSHADGLSAARRTSSSRRESCCTPLRHRGLWELSQPSSNCRSFPCSCRGRAVRRTQTAAAAKVIAVAQAHDLGTSYGHQGCQVCGHAM
jgi:hypothetical protein